MVIVKEGNLLKRVLRKMTGGSGSRTWDVESAGAKRAADQVASYWETIVDEIRRHRDAEWEAALAKMPGAPSGDAVLVEIGFRRICVHCTKAMERHRGGDLACPTPEGADSLTAKRWSPTVRFRAARP